jgi:DNA repair exonuclease SbcCD ATPase subunit
VHKEREYEEELEVRPQIEVLSQELDLENGTSEGYKAFPGITLLEERDRQRQQLGSKLRELTLQIKTSEGYQIRNGINLLRKNYFIFDGNYVNLKHVLEEFEQPMVFLKLWDEKDRHKLDLYINEVVRYFHNYLAGAVSLLDHTRVFIEDTRQEADFTGEYKQRMDRDFTHALLPNFMRDLRHYMLHRELPFALAELNFSAEGGDMELNSAIRLDVTKLRDWQGWSESGRKFLDTLDDKVRLSSVINEYASVITGFNRWFGLRQSELHQAALRHLEKLEGEREHLEQELKRLDDLFEVTEKATSSLREEREILLAELRREREVTDRLKADLENARRSWWRR